MGGGGFNTAPVPAASYIAAPAMFDGWNGTGAVEDVVMAFGIPLSFYKNFHWM